MKIIALAVIAGLASATLCYAEEKTNDEYMSNFLQAADANDFNVMQNLLSPNVKIGTQFVPSSDFLKQLKGCYLRRVYRKVGEPVVIAAWMCSEGANKSRVLLGDLGLMVGGLVTVDISLDQHNPVAAPPRKGSAFAN